MSDFITDGASVLPSVKSDKRTPTGASWEWAAEDSNDIRQALLDVRNIVLANTIGTVAGVNVSSAVATGTGGTTLRTLATRFADVANVKDFGASGSSQTTTGSISASSTQLTVASAIDFAVGQGISVANAGAASALLVAKITAINGLVFTLDTAAGTNASTKAVKHDDTAAIRAAIAASSATDGGPVFLPQGNYVVSGTLTARKNTSVIGSGMTFVNSSGVVVSTGTTIDGTAILAAPTLAYAGNACGFLVRDIYIKGAPAGTPGMDYTCFPLQLPSCQEGLLDHVMVTGGWQGVYIGGSQKITLRSVFVEFGASACLYLDQSSAISIFGGQFSNSGGQSQSAGLTGNVVCYLSNDVNFHQTIIDESFGASSKSIMVLGGSRIRLFGARIFYPHGGYGIRLGDGVNASPTDCAFYDISVGPFAGDRVPTNTITVYGSGHKFVNVVTAANGGGDIVDGTDSIYVDVNGLYKMPNLRSTDPGAGSKQLWYDAADANRVKFAP